MTPIPITGRPHLRIVGGHRLPDSEGVLPSQEYLTFLATCPHCTDERGIRVSSTGALKWQKGTNIQDALPELNDSDREGLMTGICQDCWDAMFQDPSTHEFKASPQWADVCNVCGEPESAHEEN